MEPMLTKYNKILRRHEKSVDADVIIRRRKGLLHVCITSEGCRYQKAGSCTMCNYGMSKLLPIEIICEQIKEAVEKCEGINSILLGTMGSIWDLQEIPEEYIIEICNMLSGIPINTIIFETHYLTITKGTCDKIRRILPDKDLVVEFGLESIDSDVQKFCLNKIIDREVLVDKLKILRKYQFSITANVFLGAPFLTVQERKEDALSTIKWCIYNQIDSIVIFPANIRKGTLLQWLYEKELYQRVSHKEIYDLLSVIPSHYLNRIYLSWYGDWVDISSEGKVINIIPDVEEIPKYKWEEFYGKFLNTASSYERKEIVESYSELSSGVIEKIESNWIDLALEDRMKAVGLRLKKELGD